MQDIKQPSLPDQAAVSSAPPRLSDSAQATASLTALRSNEPPVGTPSVRQLYQKRLWLRIGAIFAVLVLIVMGLILWFLLQLQPKDTEAQPQRIAVPTGASVATISAQLQNEGVIRNATAFQLYSRAKGLGTQLQAGTYVLSPSQSVPSIASDLANGKVDLLRITIVPGQTLQDISATLVKNGFKAGDVSAALQRQYDHPLLRAKPPAASLEGYIFPDTYSLASSGSVEDLLKLSFDRFYQLIQSEKIVEGLAAQNLSLHQGIILGSIVQQEVPKPDEQKQVAQVFLKRLRNDIELGSDVTFIYAARQLGVTPSVGLDSPYNTRRVKGLPPGPIANFNLSALQAVVAPAPGEFLYFVAGDDRRTYFAHTLEEHERNTALHCIKLCAEF